MDMPDRHMGELSAEDDAFFAEVVRLALSHNLPFGRAVFLFGRITRVLTDHAVKTAQAELHDAVIAYVAHFMAGMGAQNIGMDIDVQVVRPEERH
jgi:hypothetical protein